MNDLVETRQMSVYADTKLYNEALKMAEGLSKSDLVPDNYKGKPESCLIAIDVARQIGARSPIFVMQNLYVVKGKPSWSGQYCDAIVRANFNKVKVDLSGEGDERGCKVTAYDENNNFCEGTRVTIRMAKQEGWFNKQGSKWQTIPDLMLQYRAFAFFARVHCPDKLLGIHDEFENLDITKIERKADNPFIKKEDDILDIKEEFDNLEVIDVEVVKEPEREHKIVKDIDTTPSLVCEKCGKEIDQKVYDYSTKVMGKALCYKCQKEGK